MHGPEEVFANNTFDEIENFNLPQYTVKLELWMRKDELVQFIECIRSAKIE